MFRPIVPLIVVAALATSAQAQPYANYACSDGAKLTVIFEPGGTALVMVGGGALRLADRRPGSGFWFSSPAGEFRGKGAQATFRMAGRRATRCRLVERGRYGR